MESSLKTKSNELASKEKELKEKQTDLEERLAEQNMLADQKNNIDNEIKKLEKEITDLESSNNSADSQKTELAKLKIESQITGFELNSVKVTSKALESLVAKLKLDRTNISNDLEETKVSSTKQIEQLNATISLISKRTQLVLQFTHQNCPLMQSKVASLACQDLKCTAQSNYYVFKGIESLNKANEYVSGSEVATGTVTLIGGVGASTSAVDRPTVIDLPMVGQLPGVSNTAEFDSTLDSSRRISRNAGQDSAVEPAPGATGAVSNLPPAPDVPN